MPLLSREKIRAKLTREPAREDDYIKKWVDGNILLHPRSAEEF